MRSVRPRTTSALLALIIGATAVAGAPASPAAAADGTAPTGAYALTTTSIWAQQYVQLVEASLTDDVDLPAVISRVVTWGDGTTEPIPAGATALQHTYAGTGTFTVSVLLTDTEGNAAAGTIDGPAEVTVAATPGTFKLDKTVGYVWTDMAAPTPQEREGWSTVTVSLADIPSTVWRVRLIWGDGSSSLVKPTAKKAIWNYQRGTYKITAAMVGDNGQSAPKAVGTLKVVEDTYKPTIAIKTPKSPTKASSWKTINGTTADKGLGVVHVEVWIWQKRGSVWYYYNFTKKKWVKYKGGELPKAAIKAIDNPVKNAWKVSVAGIKKGLLEVNAVAADGNWNWSDIKVKTQKIK